MLGKKRYDSQPARSMVDREVDAVLEWLIDFFTCDFDASFCAIVGIVPTNISVFLYAKERQVSILGFSIGIGKGENVF